MPPARIAAMRPEGLVSSFYQCVLFMFGALAVLSRAAVACDCHAYPVCFYVSHADIIFLGKVTYSNDNGLGTFVQATLVRFEVEEVFKGQPTNPHEVWIDPGSFTSCYAEYQVGKRYLVFASSNWDFTHIIATTIIKGPGPPKPLPPGFDRDHPPTVYLAPECTGTREVPEQVDLGDLAFLRSWKAGKTVTRVYGRVLDHAYAAWPQPDPPALRGATVTLTGATLRRTATTDSHGAYSFTGIPAGQYSLSAALDGYRGFPNAFAFDLAPGTCGYAEFDMITDGVLEGTVNSSLGRPVKGIEVRVQRVLPGGALDFVGFQITDKRGAFLFSDVPQGDFQLGVNLDSAPTAAQPYPRFYFPGTTQPTSIHLNLHEHRRGLVLKLPPPLKIRTVGVRVAWADSTPVAGATVSAFGVDGEIVEVAQTDKSGYAKLRCLADVTYQIEAQKWLRGSGPLGRVAAKSERSELPAGFSSGIIKLKLAKTSKPYER